MKNKRTEHMFPLKTKQHEMKTSHEEKYKVSFAHTNRMKNSLIIYMQKLLNENENQNKTTKIKHRIVTYLLITDEAVNFCTYRVVLPLNIFVYAISLNKLSLIPSSPLRPQILPGFF